MTEGVATPDPKPALWHELTQWAANLARWQRYVLGTASTQGPLTPHQIDQAYTLFLFDHGLGKPVANPAIPTIAARPTEKLVEKLVLTRVDDITGVNALPSRGMLTFGPQLTVIYGGNGAGKSGYARLLANACYSRQRPNILPDIYAEGQRPPIRATFHLAAGDEDLEPLGFSDPEEVTPLKRIAVFDAMVARHHISQTAAFEFKPAGFDVFPELSRVCGEVAQRLEGDIAKRSRPNTFPPAFLGGAGPTIVHSLVEALGADTDLEALKELGRYGPTESARIAELDLQLLALRSQSPRELLRERQQARADVASLHRQLSEIARQFTPEATASRAARTLSAKEKSDAAVVLGADQFRRSFFRAVGSPAWGAFISQFHAFAMEEGSDYPSADARCLLCERPLDEASRSHVAALLKFVESDARQQALEAQKRLTAEVEGLRALDLAIFAPATRVRSHVQRLDPTVESVVAAAIGALAEAHTTALEDLGRMSGTAGSADASQALSRLASLAGGIEADIARLSQDNTDQAIASMEAERRLLRHRHVLSQQLAEIERWLEDAKWVRTAVSARTACGTRFITDKEKELFARVVGDGYRNRLAAECKALDCTVPVELRTVGREGRTVRSLTMPGGHKPHEVLSEGEQRAVALADFLTEVDQNPAGAGIVLDDPVTSQDHERKRRIAARLAAEAETRQVIVFTHDLVFLSQLSEASEAVGVGLVRHWVERTDNRPGHVTLDDGPGTERDFRKTDRAKAALAAAKQETGSAREAAVRRGMGSLRRTLEELVVAHLFKNVVPRWEDRVIVTALPKIAWDYSKVQEISDLYQDISAYIEGHTHTDLAMGAPPTPEQLEARIAQVDALLAWARRDRD
jgi:AAA domain